MNTRRRNPSPFPFLIALLLLGAAACNEEPLIGLSEEEDPITEPAEDVEPPSVVLTSAPATSQANHEVLLEFEATDDVALASATVDWGTPGGGGPIDEVPLQGTSSSASFTHAYPAGDQYDILVQVRDTAGLYAGATHQITITEFAPEAPADISAEVGRTLVAIRWTPGAWAERHEVIVSRTDAPEADRTWHSELATTGVMYVTYLSWDASYTAVVVAENPWGRTASEPVAFRTPAPDPPLLKRFSPLAADPTCLVLEWTLSAGAEGYRAAITGDGVQDPIEQLVSSTEREVQFCTATHPIVDGTTYTAQVFSVIGDREYGSNRLDYAVDFNLNYSLTGSWTATWMNISGESEVLRLHLEDADGRITGSWEGPGIFMNYDSGPLSGTRIWGAIDLSLEFVCVDPGYCPPNPLIGEFIDEDTIEAILYITWFDPKITLTRD